MCYRGGRSWALLLVDGMMFSGLHWFSSPINFDHCTVECGTVLILEPSKRVPNKSEPEAQGLILAQYLRCNLILD